MAPKWWLDLGAERRKNGRLWHVQADVSTTRDHVSGRLRCSFRVGRAAQTRSFASRPAKIASWALPRWRFHGMLLGWNLRRQSDRLWKSTVRSCHARCAAPHASPAPSAGTWIPGAAPALLRPGWSNAVTSAALEAAGFSTGGSGRAACGLWPGHSPWELRAAQSRQARRPEERRSSRPRAPLWAAFDHAVGPAMARLPTQPRPKSVSHARLSSPG